MNALMLKEQFIMAATVLLILLCCRRSKRTFFFINGNAVHTKSVQMKNSKKWNFKTIFGVSCECAFVWTPNTNNIYISSRFLFTK